MALYTIICTAVATIEETWTVEANSPADAHDKLFGGDGSLTLISEHTLGDEENRAIETMTVDDKDVPEGAWYEDD